MKFIGIENIDNTYTHWINVENISMISAGCYAKEKPRLIIYLREDREELSVGRESKEQAVEEAKNLIKYLEGLECDS